MINKTWRVALFLSVFSFFCAQEIFAQVTARAAANESAQKETIAEAIEYLHGVISAMSDGAEKRSLYYFLGSLQEQAALYEDARASYVAAAAIGAGDAHGMPKRSSEQLVLDAVRTSLSCGDWQTADLYLNSAVRNSADDAVQAYVKLYSVWSLLCRADSRNALEEPLALLRAYSSISNMEIVRPQVLFTLWYLTGEQSWSGSLKKRYPASLETGIVNGTVRLLPAPFWYFVPHNEITVDDTDGGEEIVSIAGDGKTGSASGAVAGSAANGNVKGSGSAASSGATVGGAVKLQLGLFRDKANADALVKRVGERGFSGYITTETRSSGTTYYIVLVDDSDGSVADKLRSAGFECYRYE